MLDISLWNVVLTNKLDGMLVAAPQVKPVIIVLI